MTDHDEISALAEWLRQCQIDTVVMESTGVYWIPLFEVLEERGFDVKLVDPHYVRQVTGHKTDVEDCQWLQELHTYGLLRGAFRPYEFIQPQLQGCDTQIEACLQAFVPQVEAGSSLPGVWSGYMRKPVTAEHVFLIYNAISVIVRFLPSSLCPFS